MPELIGRDWARVYRSKHAAPCIACGRSTFLVLSFRPGTAIAMCGSCRGY